MATLHYFDRYLRHFLGHFHDEADAITAAARARGFATRIYFVPVADPAMVAAFGGTTIPLPETAPEPGVDPIRYAAARMEQGWRALGPDPFAPGDVLFLSSLRPGELVGICHFLATLPPGRRPATVLRIYDGDAFVEPGARALAGRAALWRRAMAEIADIPCPPILASETPALARAATRILGRRVLDLPIPVAFDAEPAAGPGPSAWEDRTSPRVLFICHRRGIAVADLARCLARIRTARPDASLLVKLNDFKSIMHVREHAYITRTLAVPVLTEFLPRAALSRLMAEADLVVLPYRVGGYEFRSSGPFAEAAAIGRPTVIPVRTWMAAEMDAGRGAGMIYADDRPEVIAGATVAAIGRLDALQRRAAIAAAAARRTHGPDRFVLRLLDLAREAAAGGARADGIALGTVVGFDALGDGYRLLGEGWGAAGVLDTPIAASRARLCATIDGIAPAPSALNIAVELAGPPAGSAPCRVTLRAGTNEAATWVVEAGSVGWHRATLAAPVDGRRL
ncbi:MAG: hypothetical protein IT561_08380, partial [Alphaproteobacteria bacterium]|nr:hypothetical protein [Alphaproteobacteria bacterium]